MKKKLLIFLAGLVMAIILTAPSVSVKGESAAAVSVGAIDYENFEMVINKNGNNIVYFSVDKKKTWNEVEGVGASGTATTIIMDISWTSASSDTQIYFKGDKEATVVSVTLPKQNSSFKVKFDKVDCDFTFSGNDEATSFYWRKSTDYTWTEVSFATDSASYKNFIKTIESMRFKGAKIILRTGQEKGTSAENVGMRPSKEVKVTIAKIAAAPSIKVNVVKMTLNTKESMEYYDSEKDMWIGCEKNMTIADIAPEALYGNKDGAKNVTVQIRKAATESRPASQSCVLVIPAQKAAPTVGDDSCDVRTYKSGTDFILCFRKASAKVQYEYCIVKAEDDFEVETAKWKTVKNTKEIKLSEKKAPAGSTIYVRVKGVAENAGKKIALVLASDYNEILVK